MSNLDDFDPNENSIGFSNMLDLDKWIFEHAIDLQKEIIRAYGNFEFHLIYQLVHQFCVVEMGGFYLDIIKDRQYTTGKDSLIRRSGQTVMYHLIQMLVRWLAPILSYTADEIWKHIPGEKNISVFLEDWYENEAGDSDSELRKARWKNIILVRDEVNKQFEKLRNDGVIGSSLDAEVNIYCNKDLFKQLDFVKDELKFVLISSTAKIYPLDKRSNEALETDIPDLFILAKQCEHKKCERCWHRHESIGKNDLYETLCLRCIENITKDGEVRLYA